VLRRDSEETRKNYGKRKTRHSENSAFALNRARARARAAGIPTVWRYLPDFSAADFEISSTRKGRVNPISRDRVENFASTTLLSRGAAIAGLRKQTRLLWARAEKAFNEHRDPRLNL